MSRNIPRQGGVSAHREKHFPLRLFHPQRPKGRFKTNGSGVIEDAWKQVTAFEICEGVAGGLIAMYDSTIRPREAIRDVLRELEYTNFLAYGRVDSRLQQIHFEEPADLDACKDWLGNAANDVEFLRCFGCYSAFGAKGENLGNVRDFCIRSNGDV